MNTLNFKEGQTYICIKTNSPWWTVGKAYTVVLDDFNEPFLVDDENDYWSSTDINLYCNQFELKEEQPNVTMEDVKSNTLEPIYTPCDINKIIIKAYQTYNNDAQRLAFLKGYFAK